MLLLLLGRELLLLLLPPLALPLLRPSLPIPLPLLPLFSLALLLLLLLPLLPLLRSSPSDGGEERRAASRTRRWSVGAAGEKRGGGCRR